MVEENILRCDVLTKETPHTMDDSFLLNGQASLLVVERRRHHDIVIGVPHHAPAGRGKLPRVAHRRSDENVGFIGRYVAESLGIASVIACNYPIDVNKSLATDYSRIILDLKPHYLVEIHGHGNRSAEGVEISSGRKERTLSRDFANALLDETRQIDDLKYISVCGEFDSIYFKAEDSATITTDSWRPLHIELPPELRIPSLQSSVRPPAIAYQFADCIVHAIKKVCV